MNAMGSAAVVQESWSGNSPSEVPPSGIHSSDSLIPPSSQPRRGPGTYDRHKTADERRSEQRRALIVAAARVFARDGFAEASVASILAHTNLSRGTFYRHFRDLSDVFLATRQSAADLAFERVRDHMAREQQPFEQTRAALLGFFELIAEQGDLARVFLREAPHYGSSHEKLHRETIERFAELFRQGLRDAQSLGLIENPPADAMIYAVVHGIVGMARQYLDSYNEAKAGEAVPVLLDLCRRAFA
jgi:AcrR family transcriptional regulator